MEDKEFYAFVSGLMRLEIAPAIPYAVDQAQTEKFSDQVADRFRNPRINHLWLSISTQYTLKLKTRVIPLLVNHYRQSQLIPERIALGFVAFIRLMKVSSANGVYYAHIDNKKFEIKDDQVSLFHEAWLKSDLVTVVQSILKNKELWDTDLTVLPGFENAVQIKLEQIIAQGVLSLYNNKIIRHNEWRH